MKICPRSSRSTRKRSRTLWLATTKAPQDYCQADLTGDCWLFFGKETAGLPEAFRLAHADPLRPPAHARRSAQPEPLELRRHPHL